MRAIWVLCVLTTLFATPLATAAAQDTLSDSAWNAQRAQRAAKRKQGMMQIDSVALTVDTIIVTPTAITLHVGDTIPASKFYDRFHTIGLTLSRDTVRNFTQTMSISRDTNVVQMRDGILYVRAPGRAELRVGARRRFNVDDVTRPLTRVPIIVQ